MKIWRELGLLSMSIGLLVWWEGISQPGWPREGDALLHGYRALEMARMWQAGVLYPRWAPDLAGGAGYPLFVFHAPLFPWSVAALIVGLGFPLDQAMKVVLMGAAWVGSAGAYWLARRWGLSQAASMVAGLAFGYMPFQLQQSNYPQYVAVNLIPWLLISIDYAIRQGGFRARSGLAVSTALLGLCHNLSAMMGYSVAFAYALLVIWKERAPVRRWAKAMAAFIIGLGMALPYLGPSFTDIGLVHLERARTGVYEATRHFLTVPRLLSMPPLRDERWGNHPHVLTFGLHQMLLALPSLNGILPFRRRARRPERLWGWILLLILTTLMLPVSYPVWAALPFLHYIQFPWRWLGPAGLIIALLIGLSIEDLKPGHRWPCAFAAALILILGVLGLIYDGGSRRALANSTLKDLHRYEQEQQYPGLTATGELFPRWVEGWPETPPDVAAAYARGEEPSRLDLNALPPGAQARLLYKGPLDQAWEISSALSFPARFWILGYPGWQVLVNGMPISAWVEAGTGWLRAEMPAGVHTVRVRFQSRWLWRLFDHAALTLWSGWSVWAILRKAQKQKRKREERLASAADFVRTNPERPRHWSARGACILFLATIGFHLPYHLWSMTRVPLDRPPGADLSVRADFEGQVRLAGYSIERWTVRPGEIVRLTLWWRALRTPDEDVHVYVHGIPADRPLLSLPQAFQSDHVHPGGVPARLWDPEKHYRDDHYLRIPADIRPGPYRIRIGLYSGPEGRRWRTADDGSDGIDLPFVLVVSRPLPPCLSAISFGGVLLLEGYEQPGSLRAGQPFTLWFGWRAQRSLLQNYTFFVHLLNERGELIAQQDLFQLTALWPMGSLIPLGVDLPPLPPGRYRIRIGWYLWPSMEHLSAPSPTGNAPYWETPNALEVKP
jgi:hypothetical protein